MSLKQQILEIKMTQRLVSVIGQQLDVSVVPITIGSMAYSMFVDELIAAFPCIYSREDELNREYIENLLKRQIQLREPVKPLVIKKSKRFQNLFANSDI